MIIKGKARSRPGELAAHLGNAEKNERVSLIETRGTLATDLRGALIEMDAYAAGTRCCRSLYHAALSPEPPHRLTEAQRTEAINALEERLGLTGNARVVVMHEKLGREHLHVVWSRIDLDTMRAIPDSHNYRAHEEVARDLERRFGHEKVQGAHVERDGVKRPARTPSRAELRQEERSRIRGRMVRDEITAAYTASDSADAFKAALEEKGYMLARGDRRDFVVIDSAGEIHSLARRIEGVRAAELREFMQPIDPGILPGAEDAAKLRKSERGVWEDPALAKAYQRGEDYVSQSMTALRDAKARQKRLDKLSTRDPTWERIEDGESRREREAAQAAPIDGTELTAEQRQRLERLDKGPPDAGGGNDRQNQAPGHGPSRSL